jgi:hypothetical protein
MLSSNMLTPRGFRASGQSTQRSNAFTAAHAAPQQQRVSTRTQALGVSITTQIVTTALIAGAWYLSQQQQDVEQVSEHATGQACSCWLLYTSDGLAAHEVSCVLGVMYGHTGVIYGSQHHTLLVVPAGTFGSL